MIIITQIVPTSENNNHNNDNSKFVAKIGIVVAVTMITVTILIILTIILTITPIVGNNTNVHFFRVAIHTTVVLISGFGDEHPIILAHLPLDGTTLYLWSESITVTSLGQESVGAEANSRPSCLLSNIVSQFLIWQSAHNKK